MGFAAPIGLLALVAIAIPLLIHLARKPAQPIRVGSVRYLEGSAPRPRVGARVNEILLLLLRMALLVLLAMAIAEPFVEQPRSTRGSRQVSLVADSSRDIWSLLRELDDTIPAGSSIALSVPGRITVSGARPAVAAEVRIQVENVATAQAFAGGRRRQVLVAAPESRGEALRYLSAAFEAIAAANGDTVRMSEVSRLPPDSLTGRWMIALGGPEAAESLAAAGGIVLRLLTQGAPLGAAANNASPQLFVRRVGSGVVYELDARIDPGGMFVSGALPAVIASIWPGDTADRAERVTVAQLQPASRTRSIPGARTAVAMPILLAAILVFMVERVMAHGMLGARRKAA